MALIDNRTFTVVETHGRAVKPENRLVANSEDVGWRSLHARAP